LGIAIPKRVAVPDDPDRIGSALQKSGCGTEVPVRDGSVLVSSGGKADAKQSRFISTPPRNAVRCSSIAYVVVNDTVAAHAARVNGAMLY